MFFNFPKINWNKFKFCFSSQLKIIHHPHRESLQRNCFGQKTNFRGRSMGYFFALFQKTHSFFLYFCGILRVLFLFSPRLNFSKEGQLPERLRIPHFLRDIHAIHNFSDRAAENVPELAMKALAQTSGTTIVLKPQLKAIAQVFPKPQALPLRHLFPSIKIQTPFLQLQFLK